MPHRPPTRFDIGREVEVEIEGKWIRTILQEVNSSYVGTFCGLSDYLQHFDIALVRVPYTTSDPIAELSAAADWLAERGQDEAARVLMAEIERRQNPRGYNQFDYFGFLADRWPYQPAPSNEFREFNELAVRRMMLSLSIPRSLIVQDPPEPQP